MVDSRGGINLAALRDVTLHKNVVRLCHVISCMHMAFQRLNLRQDGIMYKQASRCIKQKQLLISDEQFRDSMSLVNSLVDVEVNECRQAGPEEAKSDN